MQLALLVFFFSNSLSLTFEGISIEFESKIGKLNSGKVKFHLHMMECHKNDPAPLMGVARMTKLISFQFNKSLDRR